MDMNDATARRRPPDAEPSKLSLTELTEQAAVTVRTVRYYIAEGLLPPPVTAGRQSHYTRGHLDRLRLIARLKDAYLPLREIRRRLAGLDDAAVRALLAREETPAPERMDSARSYIDDLLQTPPRMETPLPRQPRRMEAAASLREDVPDLSDRYAAAYEPPSRSVQPASLTIGTATPLQPTAAAPVDEESEPWRRVRLAEDAELLIRESAYQQRRDRIDWLIRWARRVFR
jgi:DNA-binding transcriptional MerR regulator